jgi:hypothetical protein
MTAAGFSADIRTRDFLNIKSGALTTPVPHSEQNVSMRDRLWALQVHQGAQLSLGEKTV